MHMRFCLALPVIASALASPMGGPRGPAVPTSAVEWQTMRLDLDVALDPGAGELTGRGTYLLRPMGAPAEEIALEIGEAMEILEVESDREAEALVDSGGRSARVRFDGPAAVGDSVTVRFEFRSVGRGSQMVVDSTAALASWARTWYPVPSGGDPSAPGTIRLTLPASWLAISNGERTDRRTEGPTAVETWVSERPAARSFAAGPYREESRRIGGRTVRVLRLGDPAGADDLAAALTKSLEALEARFGPYPYPGYALAEIPADLIEWTGSSEQGFFMVRSDALDGPVNLPLFAHELAHGWWGNWVRAEMPGSLMVGEALAQYSAVLAIETIEGPDAATEFLRFSREGYNPIQSARGFWALRIAGHDRPLAELTGEGSDHNLADAKGHWVYHMLRRRLGDERFFAVLRALIDEHGGETLSLPELRQAFVAAAAPEDELETFFAQWLDRAGAPVLDVAWEDASEEGRHAARVVVRQRTPEPYHLRVTLGIESAAGTRVHTVELTEATTRLTLEADGVPTGVVENPDHQVLLWEAAYCPQ